MSGAISKTTNPKTMIANIVKGHLRRNMFGMEIEGEFRTDLGDGRRIVLTTRKGFGKEYGQIAVLHSELGRWLITWRGGMRAGAPKLHLTADEIRTFCENKQTREEHVYWAFNMEPQEMEPVVWDYSNQVKDVE